MNKRLSTKVDSTRLRRGLDEYEKYITQLIDDLLWHGSN